MKAIIAIIIIVYLCLVSLPSIVRGQPRGEKITLDDLLKTVNEIAANGRETINEIFKPSMDGLLGRGGFGFTYKGKLLSSNREVAMKFTPQRFLEDAQQEYEMYTCLGAINNTNVELFGVPTVYYYGRWHGHVMIALTLLDSAFHSKYENRKLNDADIMIIFQKFVRIFKYIHSRGICHEDIKYDNLMFDKHHAFIIDYNSAIKMYGNSCPEPSKCAIEDLKDFLAVMCHYYGISFNWFSYRKTTAQIEKIKNDGLRRIFLKFAEMIFKVKVPNYNGLFHIINDELMLCKLPKTEWFSWLATDRRKEATIDLINDCASIQSVGDPFKNNNFRYPEVNFNYFDKKRNRVSRSIFH